MKINYLVTALLITNLLLGTACNRNGNTQENSQNTEKKDSVSEEERAWKEAEAKAPAIPLNDHVNQLHGAAKEFKKVKKVNQALLDSVSNLVAEARKMRYTPQTMADVKQLDAFDNTLNLLMDKLDRLETTTSYLKTCRECMNIFEEIRQLDNQDVVFRSRYTGAAKELNELLQQKGKEIENLGEQYKHIKSFPMFAIE
jgi:uncharacterized phage infection (PIP) family protein YhgE